jgi:peptidyl-prolyl cis-trans isomerase SurA
MILASLQLQLADRNGIRVDDDTLNHTIERIAADNKLSLPEFRSVLEKEGYDFATFREDIRREILISRVQQRQVSDRIMVSEQEIDNYLANQRAQGNTGAEYHLAHILIAVPDASSAERIQAARKRAEDVLAKLRAGANFQETAIAVSDGQQALQGGDLGWRKAGELPTLFVDPVLRMKAGDISDIIRSPSGFHIIKLLEQRDDQRHIITQTHARHILIRTDELTGDEAAQARLNDIRQRIKDGADFAELARNYSNDTASAANGGDLGWVNPGDMVPAFEAELDKLATGEISKPFKTGFGWHIVQVLERRRYDNTDAYIRSQAQDAIRQRKTEEELQSWLARLRDDAYIENRLASP